MSGMEVNMTQPTRLDYCQYLLSSSINYTLTHFADHSQQFSHDMINRYLAGEHITPRLVWENVKPHIVETQQGYVIFDDTVLDKRYAQNIALVRRQYSGNAKGVINGIGVVTCVYVNPALDRFWLIDYRIYDPQTDGKRKLEHVKEMLSLLVYSKQLCFSTVLMDSWTKDLMLLIERLVKHYYCPLKSNRQVDDSNRHLSKIIPESYSTWVLSTTLSQLRMVYNKIRVSTSVVNNDRCSLQKGSRHTPHAVTLVAMLPTPLKAIRASYGTRRVPTTMP